jgi:hypothetical protein
MFQWSYYADCESMISTICDIAYKQQHTNISMQHIICQCCNELHSKVETWVCNIIQVRYGHIPYVILPPTSNPRNNIAKLSEQNELSDNENVCCPESNIIWQSWKEFRQRTEVNEQRKRKRLSSQVICLSPPRLKIRKESLMTKK